MSSNSHDTPVAIFAGRSNPDMARRIAVAHGKDLGAITLKDFSDGEIYVRFGESIRGADVFLVQSTQPQRNGHPCADNWMELLLMIDAAKRASASRITAVIPYFGYARQERKDQPRVSIAARLMADMLSTAGVDRVLTMDLHAPQIQGFFDMPVDHLYASVVLDDYFRKMDSTNLVVVAPDAGSLGRSRSYAKRIDADIALIDKRRPRQNETEVMNIVGDVAGRNVILIDDLVDTAGTLTTGANALREAGAQDVTAACTHALLSGPAYERIERSALDRLVVTDTIPLERDCDKIEVVSVAGLFSDAIRRIYTDDSISTLFVD
jgi:ribose-phosphate pyrophosphokinase